MIRISSEDCGRIDCDHSWEKPMSHEVISGLGPNPVICRKCGTIKGMLGAGSTCGHEWERVDDNLELCLKCKITKRSR